ncbi:hypothetical protein [Novosphingobium sp. TCA1]|uniref:hypothetical protein n=1 Tax=Novosphingobium sp. TCA1 TaxID=2682474 RepID=UPI001307A274|nr:hypothetical protein [Novosphingobium sp. TCA1]GFE73490.1 phage-like protein [Novosphingobium sp. TCA1]
MADKGIIFSAPMVRALLAGTKTQTRRLCKWANNPLSPALGHIVPVDNAPGWFGDEEGEVCFSAGYKLGDRLYVREACAIDGPRTWYRLDHVEELARGPRVDVRWRPSIHMPRSASRMWLAVTEVRMQRLQECSEDDAIAEGWPGEPGQMWPLDWYRDLWDSLHTTEGQRWQDNPWVVAVSFDVHHGNIDAERE